jgi:protein-S-isoprenylcysteine O-methyltransferase Ste14
MKALENKIPPPLVAVVFAVLMWCLAMLTPKVQIDFALTVVVASLLFVLGVFFAISGVLSFRNARTTIDPLKPHTASTLVNTGIYRLTRNPMYVGLAFALGGWGFYLASPASLIGLVGYILYIHGLQIRPEERALLELFGDEYREYQAKVRCWL